MEEIDFTHAFQALTGNPPFPWQEALYERFATGDIPQSCILPTGLGKTSVIAVWLIALANGKPVPRRLVYVVNRRTVVDQTTEEVEKYRKRLDSVPELAEVKERLGSLSLSTLRGQFADNREWSADPSRPAVICGTVDMIGSRLLFSGYGIGAKSKPLHAGFLGQDALLVHDEAHLEPAFQKLIEAIRDEQHDREKTDLPWPKLRVMELTATSRGKKDVFQLTERERKAPAEIPNPPTEPLHRVWQRTHAKKSLRLHGIADEKAELVPSIVSLALAYKNHEAAPAVLIFVRTVESVLDVIDKLKKAGVPKENLLPLTGTMRGRERDEMADGSKVFKRFKQDSKAEPQPGTVYLVSTSAGEVGVDMSADHLVCDLSPFDSMAQRYGRVNRYGNGDAKIDVVHPIAFDSEKEDALEVARERTLALLGSLPQKADGSHDASPAALGDLDATARLDAFTPQLPLLDTSDILFDSWALTTIRDDLPGRPPIEPYLHGVEDEKLAETHIAWRKEVQIVTGRVLDENKPRDLLEAYPLLPRELLKEPSYRAFKQFEALAKRVPNDPAWLVDAKGRVEVLTVADLADKDEKDRINWKTVLLSPNSGGLEDGMLKGSSDLANDVADGDERTRLRGTVKPAGMRLILTIDTNPDADEDSDEEEPDDRYWSWYEVANEGGKSSKGPVEWHIHVGDVVRQTECILASLPLDDKLKQAVNVAAMFHDHGKRRKLFQIVLGNLNPKVLFAKSGKFSSKVPETYRHEFGSLLDILAEKEFLHLDDSDKEIVLHLIAVHHGRGRPHFPENEVFDPQGSLKAAADIAAEVPRRYARLQRRYGRWGLAYLESLLRAADWAASGAPSEFWKGGAS